MLIDRAHKNWFVGITFVAAFAIVVYLLFPSSRGTYGGTIPGLIFGGSAMALMLFAALLGERKKRPVLRVGRGSTWMKGHIWLSLLLVVFVFLHSGFRTGGLMTTILWVLLATVTLTGILGLVLQQFLPRTMTNTLPMETIFDQIDYVSSQLRFEADTLITGIVGPLGIEIVPPEGIKMTKLKEGIPNEHTEVIKTLYLKELRPFLNDTDDKKLFGTSGKVESFFAQVKLRVPADYHVCLTRLAELVEEKRQFESQRRMHLWLHGWLLVHVPLSMALLLLAVAHAIMALWY